MPYAVAADGTRIHYLVEAAPDGPALMLSHALGVSLEMWEPQMRALARYRVVRYDSRGHGRSDAPAGPYSFDLLGRDALAVLDAAGVGRTAFCGLSMGGGVGQWIGANAPERVDRLVLACTSPTFGTPEVWRQRIDTVLREGMAAVVPGTIERWFTPEYRQREPEQVRRIEALLLASSPEGYAGWGAALSEADFRSGLAQIAAPTLVIGGARDSGTPPDKVQELADGIMGASLVMLEAAHMAGIEQAEGFNAALERFLA